MKVKPLELGKTTVKNNVFIAPMAGYTDFAFRNLEISLGAGLTFTELVSAKGLYYDARGTKELLYVGENDENHETLNDNLSATAAQIFGSDPYYMRYACESDYMTRFNIVDINMGCPVPKVYKNGEGSALLADINRAEKIVSECVKSGKVITVKIRTGLKAGDDVASEFAKMAENAGASLVNIHGRVRDAYYSGEPDFNAIEKAKNAVKIPIIANGGIFTEEQADEMMNKTGADGVMLARGAVADPFLVAKLTGKAFKMTLKEFVFKQLDEMRLRYGDNRAATEFRKFVAYYVKGESGAKAARISLMKCESVSELKRILSEVL